MPNSQTGYETRITLIGGQLSSKLNDKWQNWKKKKHKSTWVIARLTRDPRYEIRITSRKEKRKKYHKA
jgi:hypothetical protein